MNNNLVTQLLIIGRKSLFAVFFLITFILALLVMLFSHDIWLLIIGLINNYPQVYFDILEDQLWWNIVDTCTALYYCCYCASGYFWEINWNITLIGYNTLAWGLDMFFAVFWSLYVTKWDLYYNFEIFICCLEIATTAIVSPILAVAYVHWFSSHMLYALLAFCCDLIVVIFFEDSEWLRSIFDTNFINNNLRWYLPLFVLIIAALVLIRSSVPRYRYDYLSKIGWLKFFGITLGIIIIIVLIYFFW